MSNDLRDRIAKAIFGSMAAQHNGNWDWNYVGHTVSRNAAMDYANAVLAELDLGIPCVTSGCRMRHIAQRHAGSNSDLESGGVVYCQRCGLPHHSDAGPGQCLRDDSPAQ